MKIIGCILCFWIMGVANVYAQSYHKKQLDFNVGAGFRPMYPVPGTTPIVSGNYSINYGLTDAIGIGLYYNQSGSVKSFNSSYLPSPPKVIIYWQESHAWTFNHVGLRGVFHFNKFILNKRWDVYAGFVSGYRFVSKTYRTTNPTTQNAVYEVPKYNNEVFSSFLLGGQFQISKYVGAWVELGSGLTLFNLGLNGRLI
jgi:hypothetical protein